MRDRDRLALVLLPGLDGSGRLFSRFVRELPETIEPVVIALPFDRPRGYGELMEHVRGRLPRGRPFALLGESFSGPLALRLAAERPAGLVAVVLVATFHRRPVARWVAAVAIAARVLLAIPPPPILVRRFLAGPAAPPEVVREVREAVRGVPAAVLAGRVHAALAEDGTEALRACAVPLLYLGGARDRLLRRTLGEEVRQVAPSAQVGALETPHLVLQLAPREAVALVTTFLTRAAASGSGSGAHS